MTYIKLAATTLAVIFIALSSAQAKDRIDTKSEFIEKVAGKKVEMNSKIWLKAQKNGKIDGRIRGFKVNGKWYWKEGYWCRSARVGIIPVFHECQEISLANDKLILQRYKGKGSTHTYLIN